MTRRPVEKLAIQLVAAFAIGWLGWTVASRWWWPEKPASVASPPAAAESGPGGTSGPRIEAAPALEPLPEESSRVLREFASDLEELRSRSLLLPVRDAEAADLADDFADERSGGRRHEAIDILAPRDTPVYAVDDGRIEKLFESEYGGLTVYQFDDSGRYCYYYAHLERYPRGLAEGARVRRGDTIGFVGTSGNAPAGTPHLHFAIYRLGPERKWWEGEPINPYRVWVAPEE